MVVISSMFFAMFLLCSLLPVSQRPARGEDPHATVRLCTKNSFFLREMHKNNTWHAQKLADIPTERLGYISVCHNVYIPKKDDS